MFWTIMLCVYLGISIFDLISYALISYDVKRYMLATHPNAKYKPQIGGKVSGTFLIIAYSILPIVHIGAFLIMIFFRSTMENTVVKNLENNIIEG